LVFTFFYFLVVVTIIGILAAIAIPRVFSYIRTSSTAEISQDAANISNALSGYTQSQLLTATAAQTALTGTSATPDLTGTNEISTIIPQVQLPKDAHFNYAITAAVASAGPASGDVVYCIVATGRSNAAVSGGKVMFSSTASTQAGWDGHLYRAAYVNGQTDLTGAVAGGYCSATGTAQATFSN
jgi:type II secretory pathway pseudopilin PulG